jgi:2-C-methyl-D-erythritol 4-phosphate cytidylyltransferase
MPIDSEPSSNMHVVIPAAGAGRRMNTATPKQYLPLAGATVIEQALQVFLDHERLSTIVVAVSADDEYWDDLDIDARGKSLFRVEGGSERCYSVLNALDFLSGRADTEDWVLVHDAARPCLQAHDIERLLATVAGTGDGGLLAVPVRDTMKRADANGKVSETVDREGLWHALTPQMFRLGVLRDALAAALDGGFEVTDESSAMECAGYRPELVEGSADNIKITRPEDLRLAEFYLRLQGR